MKISAYCLIGCHLSVFPYSLSDFAEVRERPIQLIHTRKEPNNTVQVELRYSKSKSKGTSVIS